MNRLIRVHSLVLITAIATCSFPALSTLDNSSVTSKDHVVSSVTGKDAKEEKKKSVVERLADIIKRRPSQGGTQGEFCSISPSKENSYLRYTWSYRPLFVWQGTVKQIKVQQRGSESTVVWNHTLTEEEQRKQQIFYGGQEPLKTGQEYSYIVTYETEHKGRSITKDKKISLITLKDDHKKRRLIDAKLAELNNLSQTMSAEEFALGQVRLFAKEDLWLDVARVTFSVQNPSQNWKDFLEKDRAESCK